MLAALAAVGPLSIDMYLPALPAIQGDFDAAPGAVQLTLSTFFLGIAAGQLVYGPLSDRFGRRRVLLSGIALYVLTSIGCALSPGVDQLIAARLLQAMGGAVGSVMAQAMVRDLFQTDQAARMLSLMTLVMALAPLCAPLVGGQLLVWFGWRSIFWVLTAFGVGCFALVAMGIPETHPPHRRVALTAPAVVRAYATVARHPRAMGAILAGALGFSGIFAYLAGSPFVYIELFGVAPQHYGFLFALNVLGLMLGAWLNSRLVVLVGAARMLSAGCVTVAVAGAVLLAAGATGAGGLWGVVVPLWVYVGTLSLLSANAVARALSHFPHYTGTAAALYGGTQYGLGALAGTLVGVLHDGTALPMAAVIAAAGLCAWLVERLLARAPAG